MGLHEENLEPKSNRGERERVYICQTFVFNTHVFQTQTPLQSKCFAVQIFECTVQFKYFGIIEGLF